ncbi:MAG: hypothetical protein AAGG02_21360, partial [Cyanobacteria bacterium P01_H01_bin.15]
MADFQVAVIYRRRSGGMLSQRTPQYTVQIAFSNNQLLFDWNSFTPRQFRELYQLSRDYKLDVLPSPLTWQILLGLFIRPSAQKANFSRYFEHSLSTPPNRDSRQTDRFFQDASTAETISHPTLPRSQQIRQFLYLPTLQYLQGLLDSRQQLRVSSGLTIISHYHKSFARSVVNLDGDISQHYALKPILEGRQRSFFGVAPMAIVHAHSWMVGQILHQTNGLLTQMSQQLGWVWMSGWGLSSLAQALSMPNYVLPLVIMGVVILAWLVSRNQKARYACVLAPYIAQGMPGILTALSELPKVDSFLSALGTM